MAFGLATATGSKRTAGRILWTYIYHYRYRYLFAIAAIAASAYVQLQIPPLLGRFTDELQTGGLAPGDPLRYAALLATFALGFVLLYWTGLVVLHQSARRFEFLLRNRLFAHWESLSKAYYTHHSIGDLMAHATNDVNAVRMGISSAISQSVNALFLFVLVIILSLGTVDTRLAVYSLLPLPILSVIMVLLRPRIKARFREVQAGFSHLTERAQENLSGIRLVKAYAQEGYETERFRQAAQSIVDRNLRLTRLSAIINPTVQLLGAVSFLISLGYGGIRVMRGDLTLGQLVAFNSYLVMLVAPMQHVGHVVDITQRSSAALGRITELLQEKPDVRNDPHPVSVRRLKGAITLHNLHFSYPDNVSAPVLQEITLRIDPGQTVAILGKTGSGKSTLVSLLLRMYNPPRGSLFLDQHDIIDIPLNLVRQQIAYVPQEPFLFSTTIRENVSLASNRFTDDQVEHATRAAQLYETILEMPEQFETMLGERGVTLSGGQRQRLAMARALIKEAPILVLDDSLSAVDTRTEAAILSNFREMRAGRTTIIIAHRISTVRDADLIVVMDEGRIVEQGTHDELLELGGAYREIFEIQRSSADESDRGREERLSP